jgi:hypothetical protein
MYECQESVFLVAAASKLKLQSKGLSLAVGSSPYTCATSRNKTVFIEGLWMIGGKINNMVKLLSLLKRYLPKY